MRDVRWKELSAAHAYISDVYWEKRDGKTAGLRDFNHHMLVQARTERNVSILVTFRMLEFLNGVRTVPSPFYLMSRT